VPTDDDSRDRPACPICAGRCAFAFEVDFNKSCEERGGRFLRPSGIAVRYVNCAACGFCFAPSLHGWSREEFALRICNDDYILVDPDYRERRPRVHADHLIALFGARPQGIAHLDYGGGQGLMSDMLRDSGWRSTSYDPFAGEATDISSLGKFDLVTAYEVFEHVPDVRGLARDLAALVKDEGIVHFSTMLTDGKLSSDAAAAWWYASPRNGHIRLDSRDALFYLAHNEGLNFASFSPNLHAFWRTIPPWASHILR
jgi:hypothetical protein